MDKNQTNSLVVTHNLQLEHNMDALAEQIKADIAQKYDLVVTEDSVTDTKKIMAKVNEEKGDFQKAYKGFKNKILEPLTPLDAKAKEIEGLYDEAYKALKEQVKKFEAKKLEMAKQVCIQYAIAQCEEKGIDFETITISDLFTKLGSVTASGNISSTAKNEIDNRIQAVENAILKAKLEAEEKAKRDREIAEQARKEAEERASREKAELEQRLEREKQEAIAKANRDAEEAQCKAVEAARAEELKKLQEAEYRRACEERKQVFDATPKPVEEVAPEPRTDGKRTFLVNAYFEVTAPEQTPAEQIKRIITQKLADAGFTTLKTVDVQ